MKGAQCSSARMRNVLRTRETHTHTHTHTQREREREREGDSDKVSESGMRGESGEIMEKNERSVAPPG